MPTWAVLLDQHYLPDRVLVASILAQQAGLPQPVAAKLATRAWGVVWENAPQEQALAVARGLSASGFPAQVISQDRVPAASTPRRVHVLDLESEALGVQLKYSGPLEWIEWRDVLVLSAGVLKTETVTTITEETRDYDGSLHSDKRFQVDLERSVVAELFADVAHGSRLVHVRLNSREFNYAKTLGGTIHESWREKFALLLAKLGLRSERALVSPQTEALLAAGLIPSQCQVDPYFESDDDFAAFNRWLLCRKRSGLAV